MAKNMTVEEVQDIQKKINAAGQTKAKAEGAIERIEKDWETKYGFHTLDEAQEQLAKLRKRRKSFDAKEAELFTELDELVDWDSL
jgi:primosomal protein N''